jgi:hypothetical protein
MRLWGEWHMQLEPRDTRKSLSEDSVRLLYAIHHKSQSGHEYAPSDFIYTDNAGNEMDIDWLKEMAEEHKQFISDNAIELASGMFAIPEVENHLESRVKPSPEKLINLVLDICSHILDGEHHTSSITVYLDSGVVDEKTCLKDIENMAISNAIRDVLRGAIELKSQIKKSSILKPNIKEICNLTNKLAMALNRQEVMDFIEHYDQNHRAHQIKIPRYKLIDLNCETNNFFGSVIKELFGRFAERKKEMLVNIDSYSMKDISNEIANFIQRHFEVALQQTAKLVANHIETLENDDELNSSLRSSCVADSQEILEMLKDTNFMNQVRKASFDSIWHFLMTRDATKLLDGYHKLELISDSNERMRRSGFLLSTKIIPEIFKPIKENMTPMRVQDHVIAKLSDFRYSFDNMHKVGFLVDMFADDNYEQTVAYLDKVIPELQGLLAYMKQNHLMERKGCESLNAELSLLAEHLQESKAMTNGKQVDLLAMSMYDFIRKFVKSQDLKEACKAEREVYPMGEGGDLHKMIINVCPEMKKRFQFVLKQGDRIDKLES